MSRSSTQKFIARNRAPRVQIEYDVETDGAEKKVAIPFIVGVLADLSGRSSEIPSAVMDRQLKEIDLDNFDDRMREMAPRVTLNVPDVNGAGPPTEVDITFEKFDDFSPGAVASKVPYLYDLLEQRTQLANLLTYMDGKVGSEVVIEQALNDPASLAKIALAEQQGDDRGTARTPADSGQSQPEQSHRSANAELDLLAQSFKPRSEAASQQLALALRTLARQALANPNVIEGSAERTLVALVERIDQAISQKLNPILHHPDFQKLEGAWRGLHYFVRNTETDEMLKIRFMSLSKAELSKTIRKYQGTAWDQSPLFKKVYDDEFGTFGGEPYGCLIGDYEFSNSPEDVQTLSGMAQIAAAAHSPFIAAVSPSIMQMESWQQIASPRDLSEVFSTPDYAAWRSLREAEDSRYIALTMPRFLARLPYGGGTNPVEEFAFEEDCRVGDHRSYTWCNAAYAMGVNITRAFKLYGWCVRIRGVESGGLVEGLPVHVFLADDGSVDMQSPTEVSISDRWEAALTKNGFMPLVHRKNTDIAVFLAAQSLHKSAEYDDPEATANAVLAARLPCVLASCRFAHYLKCIVRDRIGAFKDRQDMEYLLNTWIAQYVAQDPASSSEEGKARRPLADAEVVLDEIEGDPANYIAKFYVRPQYQLEGLTQSLRLILKLPSEHPA
jgi:type VI secretion system protein ImpC